MERHEAAEHRVAAGPLVVVPMTLPPGSMTSTVQLKRLAPTVPPEAGLTPVSERVVGRAAAWAQVSTSSRVREDGGDDPFS